MSVSVVQMPVEDVKPYEQNAKKHSDRQIEELAKVIEEFGMDQPIVVDANNIIIKGHGRWLAHKHLGRKFIPTIVRSDLSPLQVRAARLSDNRVTSTEYDIELEQAEMADLVAEDFDLTGMGWTDKELDFLTGDISTMNEDAFVEDVAGEVERQQRENEEKAAEVDESGVPVSKVLGFKTVPTAKVPSLERFMARLEEESGKKGADALVDFIEQLESAA